MQQGKDPGILGLGVKSCPLPVEKRMVIACCEYEHILLASKEMALTTGKSTLLRKKCIFEAGTQPAFSFGKSHKWNQNSCGGNMKLCVRRLVFLIPHLILSTFHAGIRKIFLRLVLVNSPHLFFFSLSSFLHPSPQDFFQWHICLESSGL